MKYVLTILGAMFFLCCNSETRSPNRPVDLSGTWEIVSTEGDPQKMSEPTKRLALSEFGARWEFLSNGTLNITLNKKLNGFFPESTNYEWNKAQNKLTTSGRYNYFFDILRQTHDSLDLLNIESGVVYKFKRIDFGGPTTAVREFAVDTGTGMPKINGEWKLHYVLNESMRPVMQKDLNEVAKGQLWRFDARDVFKLRLGTKSANGKWNYDREIEKLIIEIGGERQAFRVASLASQALTLVDEDAGNKFIFTKGK